MTIVTIRLSGNQLRSTVEGTGAKALKSVAAKMQDGLPWTLTINSEASIKQWNLTSSAGTNWFNFGIITKEGDDLLYNNQAFGL